MSHHAIVGSFVPAQTRAHITGLGCEVPGSTPEQFDAHSRSEVARWAKVVAQSGAKID
ncbi:MAG TPA: hypothetical protein PKA20_03295 [Burkholderiaceae bacterium]|nr:hypothetical protein [Burkholderiaceae bacterium]